MPYKSYNHPRLVWFQSILIKGKTIDRATFGVSRRNPNRNEEIRRRIKVPHSPKNWQTYLRGSGRGTLLAGQTTDRVGKWRATAYQKTQHM